MNANSVTAVSVSSSSSADIVPGTRSAWLCTLRILVRLPSCRDRCCSEDTVWDKRVTGLTEYCCVCKQNCHVKQRRCANCLLSDWSHSPPYSCFCETKGWFSHQPSVCLRACVLACSRMCVCVDIFLPEKGIRRLNLEISCINEIAYSWVQSLRTRS